MFLSTEMTFGLIWIIHKKDLSPLLVLSHKGINLFSNDQNSCDKLSYAIGQTINNGDK